MSSRLRALLLLVAALAAALPARADPGARLSVAAAANLSFALGPLDDAFMRANPDVAVTSATGASGDLVAQIEHGAPFDVFLSADLHFAQVLVNAGAAQAGSLNTFAVGRLVLWTTRDGIDVSRVAQAVRSPLVRRIAIANTTTAPFGRAAMQAMERLGVWADAQSKLVVGENISQATQFVETGNADMGFVALSMVLAPRLKGNGTWAEVPGSLYDPLEQGAVVTRHGSSNPAAERYIQFLHTGAARDVLERYGYHFHVP